VGHASQNRNFLSSPIKMRQIAWRRPEFVTTENENQR
jgi:hypothetical protein